MRYYYPVFKVLGGVLMLFGLTMAVPLGFSHFCHDGIEEGFALSMAITMAIGAGLLLHCRHLDRELQPHDGFLLVTLVWTVLPVFGAIPLLLHIPGLSLTDAYFEAVSGLTTTGATVLTGLEKLPVSINVWRCFMMFLGGMGIIVLAVAILPLLGVGGSQVFKTETPGPMKDDKLTPRISETARGLWGVYFTMAVACTLAYRAAGMGWVDAFIHMCSTISLGGFAAYDSSFAVFDSAAIESVAIVFMLLAGVNFALYFRIWQRGSPQALRQDLEARVFLGLMAACVLLLTPYLMWNGVYDDPWLALRHTAFNVISVATTTGFATQDYGQWPIFAPVLLLFLCGFVTCAGSTGGGIKLRRSLLLLLQAQREFTRLLHPRAVRPVSLGGRPVDAQVLFSVQAFMLVYGAVIIVGTLLLLLSGLDIVTAFTAAVASVNNLGPGLGEMIGPSGNFQGLNDFQTWVTIVLMLLGRLELFAVLILFTPQFWRR